MEKDLGVLVDNNLVISQQCALAAKSANFISEYIEHGIVSQLRRLIVPFCSGVTSS